MVQLWTITLSVYMQIGGRGATGGRGAQERQSGTSGNHGLVYGNTCTSIQSVHLYIVVWCCRVKERSVNKRFLNSLVLQTIPHRESVGGRGSGRDSEDDARQAASDWRHEDGDGREESGRAKRRRNDGGMGGSGSDQRRDKIICSRESSRYSHDRQSRHTHRREHDTNRREYDARSRQHDTNRSERSLHHSSRERPREHTRH